MINISFYLLDPHSKSTTPLYVTITSKHEPRLRFATGKAFIASYCNFRPTKGSKDLIKRGTPFTLAYTTTLTGVRDALLLIEHELTKDGNVCTLKDIRDKYWKDTGFIADETKMSFFDAFKEYTNTSSMGWSDAYAKMQESLVNHLQSFETTQHVKLDLNSFDEYIWKSLLSYFIEKENKRGERLTNSTINKYLKCLKQFLRYASKMELFPNVARLDEWKGLQTVQSFKIALKEEEVEQLIALDLSDNPRLDKVRDLFLLEVFTGQRYSDVEKVLDRKHYDGNSIKIYQQKTGELVSIPRHTKLEKHLDVLLDKYPAGFPSISHQKFNDYLKDVCKEVGFDQIHQWVRLFGKDKVTEHNFRYNLVTTHTGRRTFCTLALKKGINPELIMRVTGHKKYDQFRDYVKVDGEDLELAFAEKF